MIDAPQSDEDARQIAQILSSWNMPNSPKGKVIVYREGDEIIGCASCYHDDQTRFDRWLNCVAVKKGHQRKGIGKALVGRFIDQLLPRHELWLETMFWNRRFYDSLGFVWIPSREIKTYFEADPRRQKKTILMAMIMPPK
jgi:GNAT superfamily N-acetyltransferase